LANSIGVLRESPLHAALKSWCAGPGDKVEVPVDGFIIDIVQEDGLVEVQTGGFSSIRKKLLSLVEHHRVQLVYPIAQDKWIVKVAGDGQMVSRRKSPKRGRWSDVFDELVRFPKLLIHPSFSLELVLTQEDEIWRPATGRAWRRRGWRVEERHLLRVVEHRVFATPLDLLGLLPGDLSEPFTTADIATVLHRRRPLAQKMAYCLREMGVIVPIGKNGNAILYERDKVASGGLS